jgi:exonuclease III
MTNIRRIPTGRGISGLFNGITIINLYATAGAEKKRDRETFYNQDITSLLNKHNEHIIITGDFNCVVNITDCTGQPSMSRALKQIITELRIQDAWTQSRVRKYILIIFHMVPHL